MPSDEETEARRAALTTAEKAASAAAPPPLVGTRMTKATSTKGWTTGEGVTDGKAPNDSEAVDVRVVDGVDECDGEADGGLLSE